MALSVSLNSSITAYNFPEFYCFSYAVTGNGVYAKANSYYNGPQGLAGTNFANGTPDDGRSIVIFYSPGEPPYNRWTIMNYCDNDSVYAQVQSSDSANIPETGWRLVDGRGDFYGDVLPLVLSGIRDPDPYAPWGGFANWQRLRFLEYV